MSDDMLLYYSPASSFSQKVVMALHYLNLKFEPKIVNLFECEQLEQKYLDINPKGEVPTLQDGELRVADSADILQYLNDTYDTRRSDEKLIPNPVTPLGRQVAELHQELCGVKVFVLTFGAAFHPQHTKGSTLSAQECEGRKAFLDKCLTLLQEKMKTAQPPYKECFNYKLTKLSTGRAMLTEESHLVQEIASTRAVLQKVDEMLANKTSEGCWLFSDYLSIADVTLMVLLFRIRKLGLDHHLFADGDRPTLQHLAAYRDRGLNKEYVKKSLA